MSHDGLSDVRSLFYAVVINDAWVIDKRRVDMIYTRIYTQEKLHSLNNQLVRTIFPNIFTRTYFYITPTALHTSL